MSRSEFENTWGDNSKPPYAVKAVTPSALPVSVIAPVEKHWMLSATSRLRCVTSSSFTSASETPQLCSFQEALCFFYTQLSNSLEFRKLLPWLSGRSSFPFQSTKQYCKGSALRNESACLFARTADTTALLAQQ